MYDVVCIISRGTTVLTFLIDNILYYFILTAIKTGRYTHEKRSQDIREIKKLEKKKYPVPEVVINENIEETKELAALLVQAQKDMYGKNYDYWISDDMIYSLAKEYHV